MKKLFGLVAFLALSFILPARAETIKVFALNVGTINSMSNESKSEIYEMLAANDIDFGYICGPKAINKFTLEHEDYIFDPVMCVQAVGGMHSFVYRKDRYEYLERLDKVSCGNGAIDVCVVKSKRDKSLYALVMPSGNQFSLVSESKVKGYCVPVSTVVKNCREKYENQVKVFVATTLQWGSAYDDLHTYLTSAESFFGHVGMGLVGFRDVETASGGVYVSPELTLSVKESVASSVAITGITQESALVAKIVYEDVATYVVSFRDFDDTVLKDEVVLEGEDATPPEDPVREGYDFAGWEGKYTEVTEDTIVTATYSIKKFPVRFVEIDESLTVTNELKSESVEWRGAATAPENPTREGHKFTGWEPADFSCVTNAMTIVAQFEPLSNIFTVRFLDDDETTVLKVEEVVGGEAATAPTNPDPHQEGDIFYGWNPSDFSCVISNMDVVAVFGPATMEVGSAEDFARVVKMAPAVATVKLTDNLDFADVKGYVPPDLEATFDGDGFVISNLTGSAALFETVRGTVKNVRLRGFDRNHSVYNSKGGLLANRLEGAFVTAVTVEDCEFSTGKSACGMAAIAYVATTNQFGAVTVVSNCVTRNCYFHGTEGNTVGGIVGNPMNRTEIIDCRFLTDNKESYALGGHAESRVGGIVGYSMGCVVRRCFAEGLFGAAHTGDDQYAGVGGIVGSMSDLTTSVIDCTNAATVLYSNYNGGAGGIVGRGRKATLRVIGCVNLGNVTVRGGGEKNSYAGCGAGGIFGGGWGNMNTYISASKNAGEVLSEDTRAAGGILGEANGTEQSGTVFCWFTNCVNTAAVSSLKRAGGIAGRLYKLEDSFTVVNCGNSGMVSCPTGNVGGVVGVIVGVSQNNDKSFYYKNIYNVMNCGTLVTESGTVGKFVGVLEGSERNAYEAQLKSAFFADRKDTDLVGRIVGKEGTGVTVDETSATNLAASAFTDRKVVKKLNVYAKANDLPLWVQTKECPDLSLFSKGVNFGTVLLIR